MSRRYLPAVVGVLTLTVIVGASFVPVSSAAPGMEVATKINEHTGLTAHSMAQARESGSPSALATMAPQSSLSLLSQASELGPHSPNAKIKLTIGLKLRHVAKLKQFLRRVQYPGSSLYHHWLTPEQFTARFGPGKEDVAKVVRFLKAHGITVKNVSANRILIHTEATTAAYEHAFGVRINDYKLNGRGFYSTTDSPRLPGTIAPLVANILGLNGAVRLQPHSFSRPLSQARGLNPYQAPPASLTFLNPLQIAHAYDWPDITDSNHGKGVTVAILTATSSGLAGLSDPHDFWEAYGLPDHTINVIPVDGDKGDTGGMGETLLDIEYSGAMGPGIIQNVYVVPDTYLSTFVDMYNQFVDDNASDVMTTSWGAPETSWGDLAETANQIFMQAAAQGISMFAAAGDRGSGDGTSQPNMADFPSVSPYVTAANGTQLNISDLAGDYGSEVVWNDPNCFGNGSLATGGAISTIFDKPDWQYGPGVPADETMRMNSGIALTASCTKPMVVLESGQWIGTAGTSAVAPQLAGLFAIAVTEHDGRLGQSNSLIYDDARNHYADDFRDVTEGNNGAYQATADWDHPTGWGSVKARNFIADIGISGPKGTLVGKITAATTGSAIAGAKVVAVAGNGQKFYATAASDGTYSKVLPAGNFSVKVSKYGFVDGTASVAIADGSETTRNFELQPAPTVTLRGKVKDGSGHGYGLYADIGVSVEGVGQVADVWTDPRSGKYSVNLPEGLTYALHVASALDGYDPENSTIKLTADKSRNFELTVANTCSAPGYDFVTGGISENFNATNFPPPGWKVTNAIEGSPVTWKLNTDWGDDNLTGGTGTSADVNSGAAYPYQGAHDSSLITPPVPVTSLHGASILKFRANYKHYSDDALDLDIRAGSGGGPWTNILHWTKDHGLTNEPPGEQERVQLASYLPASGTFQLRWRDYDTTGFMWDYYAQIDDVAIGHCTPVPGSLVTGQVTSARTGSGVVGAKVTDDLGEGANTVVNSADPALPMGTYLFFAASGNRTLTATKGNYTSMSVQVSVRNNRIITHNFALEAAKFIANPGSLAMNVRVNGSATASFTLSNMGNGTGSYKIVAINAPAPASSVGSKSTTSVPLQLVRGHFSPASFLWLQSQGRIDALATASLSPAFGDNPWVSIAKIPVALASNAGARDPATGTVYSVDGFDGVSNVTSIYAYDEKSKLWSLVGNTLMARESPAVAFINGKLFVVDGFDPQGNPAGSLEIFAPATGSVTTGASVPVAAAGGAASAIVAGKWYVVGGCDGPQCAAPIAAVEVYDPATGAWSSGPDYPQGVAYESCGGIDGKLYCAGGSAGQVEYADGYVFDPAKPSAGWSPIASIPVVKGGLWASGYTAAAGKLLVSGGVTGNFSAITNEGYAYDPASDSWSALPNSSDTVYRGASACGFYRFGGSTSGGFTANAELLPGFDQCAAVGGVPWLSLAPTQGTLAPGAATTIRLNFDGSGQKASTTSDGYLWISGDLGTGLIVPLNVTWTNNQPPVAQDGMLTTDENTSADGTLEATDPDGDDLIYGIVAQPAHGTVSLNDAGAGTYTYTPNNDYAGADSFTFQANDGTLNSNVATISVSVKAAPPPPPPPNKSSGGGGLNWLVLAALFGLALLGAGMTKSRKI